MPVTFNLIDSKIKETIILEPGDKVIFRADQPLTMQEAERIRDIIKAKLGDDFPFLVIGSDIDVTVYRETA
jgi:hypothetical protein